jgi:hypothetical protein
VFKCGKDVQAFRLGDGRQFKGKRLGVAKLLEAAKLRTDSKGRLRNAKTLRHTSLMFRFLYESEIRPHELATIAGTSSTVLEQYYLRHITAQLVQDRLTKKALAEL